MRPKWSSSSSSSPNSSIKLKTLFLNLITDMTKKKKLMRDKPKKKQLIKGSLYRLLRSLSRAKSIIKDISKSNKKRFLRMMMFYPKTKSSSIKRCNVFSGSSSFVVPITESFSFSTHGHEDHEDNHDSYLGWLEENNNYSDEDHIVEERYVGDDDDINRLADMFIARCHDKFLLEKVESYRRFQDMLARGL